MIAFGEGVKGGPSLDKSASASHKRRESHTAHSLHEAQRDDRPGVADASATPSRAAGIQKVQSSRIFSRVKQRGLAALQHYEFEYD